MDQDISEYWKAVVDIMHDGLLVMSPQGVIVSANKSAERLTGYKREELLGKTCEILHCDGCKVFKNGKTWCGLFAHGKTRGKRCTITNRSGEPIHIIKRGCLFKDRSGEVIGAVETLADISEIVHKDDQIARMRSMLRKKEGYYGILGRSRAMDDLIELINNAAQADAPAVIYGESGTGKELVAKAIHDSGARRKKPFIKVSCAALNENLLESELFGHVKGAFTGAHRGRIGRFEAAAGGDLFLDEIGDIPLSTQVKLLRVLEENEIERVGDLRPIKVDVRVISATHKDLEALVARGAFREDLFYRINVIPMHIPPLRERIEDVPLLVEEFFDRVALRTPKPITSVSPKAMDVLLAYSWPGNVRELRNAIEYAFVLCPGGTIQSEHLPPKLTRSRSDPCPKPAPAGLSEKEVLVEALRAADGNQSEAARLLGVSRVTVWKRMKKYGISLARSLGETV